MKISSRESITYQWPARLAVRATLIGILFYGLPQSMKAAVRQTLHGHVPAAIGRLTPLGRSPRTNQLSLVLGLPLRNQQALDELLGQLYDPANTNYHRYLTSTQFAEQFGPSETDYQSLIRFAESNGLSVVGTHPNRTLLNVSGSVSQIEKLFHVNLLIYQHPTEPRTFFAPDAEPSLDLDLPLLSVSGLDNFIVPRPASLHITPLDQTDAKPAIGSGPSGSYMGNDFRAAYVPGVSLNGSGQIVGLVQFNGYYSNDIVAYETQAGLPNVTLQNVLIDGVSGAPNTNNPGDIMEVTLDIEMVISMAPAVTKVMVYEGLVANNILNRIVTDNAAKQISASWTFGEDLNTIQIYKQFVAQGQSYFNASGDGGAFISLGGEPAVDTNVIAVGGTILTTTGPVGAWDSEIVWNGSNGGYSPRFPIPPYQQGISMVANKGSTTQRNVPDIAMIASGVYVISNNGQTSTGVGGTSVASPLWAGFCALINQQAAAVGKPPVGFLNPAIYTLGKGPFFNSAFHDITVGNNTNNVITTNFFAVAGYDLCTGWGTPKGKTTIDALVGTPWFVWVQFGNPSPGNGTFASPYNTLARATNGVLAGGTVVMEGGSTSERMRIAKAMTLRSAGGTATIGR
jgi:subtilase family serine protease